MPLGYKIFGGFVLLAVFIALWQWLWYQPELWNGAAKGYTTHVAKLEKDSVRWHGDSLKFLVVIAKKDSIIAKRDTTILQITSDWDKSVKYGAQWKANYQLQVMATDASANKLSYSEQKVAYYKRLIENGTLAAPKDLSALQPQDEAVVKAGLQTANREALSTAANDSLADVAAKYRVSNERLARGLSLASTGMGRVIDQAKSYKRGGVWPFNRKRRKQLNRIADSLRVAKKPVDAELDIVKVLNK